MNMNYDDAAAEVSKLGVKHGIPMYLDDFGDEFLVIDPYHDDQPPMASGVTPGEALTNLKAWLAK